MRRSTWVLLAILVLAAALWNLLKNGKISLPAALAGTATPPPPADHLLYSEEQGSISGIKVEDSGDRTVEIRRGAAGSWSLLQPEIATADPALAESAATQAAALRILAEVEQSVNPRVVGLEAPAYTVTLQTSSGEYVFLVGSQTVTGSGYYVRSPEGRIVVVATFGLEALASLLAAPPYAETPTPSPEARPAPAPTLAPLVTP